MGNNDNERLSERAMRLSAEKKPNGTIDLTPTWVGVLPLLLTAYTEGTDTGRAMALAELKRMAAIADEAKDKL